MAAPVSLVASGITSSRVESDYTKVVKNQNKKQMLWLRDAGHGGINSKGEYECLANGKMFVHKDGPVYEGVMNRRISKLLEILLVEAGIETAQVYDDVFDLSLTTRGKKIAEYCKTRKDVNLLSIHHNASKNHDAFGIEIFTPKGLSVSDQDATVFGRNIREDFPDMTYRGYYGGDQYDKEADFKIIFDAEKAGARSAILFEWGFFDHAEEIKKINTDQYAYRAAKSMLRSIKIIEGCY